MAKSGKKSKKKLFIFGGIGALLIIIIVLLATSGDKEEIIPVQTEKAAKRTITQVVSATGKIYPVYQVELRPEVNGEIVDLPVEEGDFVKKGQLLIRIKPEQYIAQRNQAKAQLESAEAMLKVREAALIKVELDYKRIKGLNEKGLSSEQELETAHANFIQNQGQYDSQKATVAQFKENLADAELQLAKTTIYSPIDGRVTQLLVEKSERVLGSSFSVGTHLMTVADLDKMEARVEVDENDVVLVSVGDTANVEIDAFTAEKFIGIVSQTGNSAKTSGMGTQDEVVNFEVRIRIVNKDFELRPGMSCDADIETETKIDVISIPIQSVTARMLNPAEGSDDSEAVSPNGKSNGNRKKPAEVVFVVEESKVKQVEVETGISNDTYIEVKKGLDTDAEIVSGPYSAISKDLDDGKTVTIQSKGTKGGEKK